MLKDITPPVNVYVRGWEAANLDDLKMETIPRQPVPTRNTSAHTHGTESISPETATAHCLLQRWIKTRIFTVAGKGPWHHPSLVPCPLSPPLLLSCSKMEPVWNCPILKAPLPLSFGAHCSLQTAVRFLASSACHLLPVFPHPLSEVSPHPESL